MTKLPPARPFCPLADMYGLESMFGQIAISGMLTNGQFTEMFEQRMAEHHGVGHGVAVSSATAGLKCLLDTIDHDGRRKVIVPTNTFFATAAAAVHSGYEPLLVDVDRRTGNVTAQHVLQALSEEVAAVIVVHIGGNLVGDTPAIWEECKRRGIMLIEDASHAHGCAMADDFGDVSWYPGGSSDAAVLSFFPTKVITTGEGGMILTNNAGLASRCKVMRNHGKLFSDENLHQEMGFNWRMSEFTAAIGCRMANKLPGIRESRAKRAWAMITELVDSSDFSVVHSKLQVQHSWYKLMVRFDDTLPADTAAVVGSRMADLGVTPSGKVFETPLHRQPALEPWVEHYGRPGLLPEADEFCARHLCLPLYTDMTEAELSQVVSTFREACREVIR